MIGVETTPAEAANLGDTVTLSVVTADKEAMRAASTYLFLCPTPVDPTQVSDAGAEGSFAACPTTPQIILPGEPPTFVVPSSGGTIDAFGREVFTVIGYSCAGGVFGLPTGSNPLPTCTGADAQGWLFTRSLYAHLPTSLNPPNNNPTISAVWFGYATPLPITEDAPPTVPHCTDMSTTNPNCIKYTFKVDFTSDSREQYQSADPITGVIGTHQERLTVGYVVSDGIMDGGFRTDSDIVPASTMSDGWYAGTTAETVSVYIYASDDRGGFTWTQRKNPYCTGRADLTPGCTDFRRGEVFEPRRRRPQEPCDASRHDPDRQPHQHAFEAVGALYGVADENVRHDVGDGLSCSRHAARDGDPRRCNPRKHVGGNDREQPASAPMLATACEHRSLALIGRAARAINPHVVCEQCGAR